MGQRPLTKAAQLPPAPAGSARLLQQFLPAGGIRTVRRGACVVQWGYSAAVAGEATVQAADQSSAPARAGLVLITLILAAGVANINLAVANVALPDIGKAFTASQTALGNCSLPPRSNAKQ